MKLSMASAIAIAALGAASVTAIADDRPELKGPPKTLGDEGKLPPSETMRNATPDMTGPNTGAATGESAGTAGTGLRMGDEPGKLPATGTVSGKVPEMRGPAPEEK
jgi:hypothetical protein